MKPNLAQQRDAKQAGIKQDAARDERVYVNLHQLLRLQYSARALNFLPKQPANSVLSGRHASRIRGRGLNFEEIRQYQPGDDIRTIDWKVTARTQVAHTRVYTEERDRPTFIILDQRTNMFFGSKLYMKSAFAACIAAITAWRTLDVGDRVGGIQFNDDHHVWHKPSNLRSSNMAMMRSIVDFNNQLSSFDEARHNERALNDALRLTHRTTTQNGLIVIISDFLGMNAETHQLLSGLRQHNDVVIGLVHDPSATQMIQFDRLVVTDGELQMELTHGQRTQLQTVAKGRIAEVLDYHRQLGIPVLPLSAGLDPIDQLSRLLGRVDDIRGPQ